MRRLYHGLVSCCDSIASVASRRHSPATLILLRAMRNTILDLRSFLVVVPGSNQQKRHGIAIAIVFLENPKRVFECLSAAPVHATIQTPRSFRVIKSGPHRSNDNLVRKLAPHPAVKAFEVLLTPLAAIRAPALRTRMNPRIIRSEEHTSELQSRVDLVCRLLLEKK